MDKLNKVYCVERTKEGFDKLPYDELKELCGWIEHDKRKGLFISNKQSFTVTTIFEGEYTTFFDYELARIFANTEMIKAILLTKNGGSNG